MNVADTALATVKKETTIAAPRPLLLQMIDNYRDDFISLFQNKNDGIRYVQTMINTVRNVPALMRCDERNVMACFVTCATAGLEPNSIAHECCIIVSKDWKTQKEIASIQYEWRGLKKLAFNTGLIKSFDYGIVREGDTFIVEKGMNPKFSHIPNYLEPKKSPTAVYCFTELFTGSFVFTAMNYQDAVSHGKKYAPKSKAWDESTDAMCLKTVIKEHFDKKLMKASEKDHEMFSKYLQAENQKLELPENFKISKESIDEIEAEYLDVPDEEIEKVFYSKETGEIFDGKN